MVEKIKNRGWVKNAAIIFLLIMLVLTLFSNHIMNRSLPEVAVKYVQSGTITAKIRGTGTVQANESYEVTVNDSREVKSVPIKVGQQVEAGDILFVLAEGDGEALEAAKDALYNANLAYQRELISLGDTSNSKDVTNAQNALNAALTKMAANYVSDAELASAKTKRDNAKADVEKYQGAGSVVDLNELQRARNAKADELTTAENRYGAINIIHGDTYRDLKTRYNNDEAKILAAVLRMEEDDTERIAYYSMKEVEGELATAQEAFDLADEAYRNASNSNRDAERLAAAQADLVTATSKYDALKEKYDTYQTLSDSIPGLESALETAIQQSQLNNLTLSDLKKKVTDAQAEVNKLQAGSADANVVAPVAGIITSVNVTAGNKTDAGTPLAVIEVPDMGYSVSFAVTAEQAKKVRVGDTGEVSNYYWGPKITAKLTSIRNDPSNPSQSKILNFVLTGEVEAGTNVTVSIGEKSATYETIVPNSAIRSDADGDFVLIVTSKSSPLGNRYTATRVGVTILASDDTNTAVSGLTAWDYVITTSATPVEPGQKVRLAGN